MSSDSFVGLFLLRTFSISAGQIPLFAPHQQLFSKRNCYPKSKSSIDQINPKDTILYSFTPQNIKMQIPSYGAAPISATFLGARVLQITFLIVLIGLTSNFVNGMVMAQHDPSKEIVGALVIVSTSLFAFSSIAN